MLISKIVVNQVLSSVPTSGIGIDIASELKPVCRLGGFYTQKRGYKSANIKDSKEAVFIRGCKGEDYITSYTILLFPRRNLIRSRIDFSRLKISPKIVPV